MPEGMERFQKLPSEQLSSEEPKGDADGYVSPFRGTSEASGFRRRREEAGLNPDGSVKQVAKEPGWKPLPTTPVEGRRETLTYSDQNVPEHVADAMRRLNSILTNGPIPEDRPIIEELERVIDSYYKNRG